MGHLQNRNIIIGVTGGIAAYKIAETIRLLRRAGASVRVIMSRGAQAFMTPPDPSVPVWPSGAHRLA